MTISVWAGSANGEDVKSCTVVMQGAERESDGEGGEGEKKGRIEG